MHHLVALTTFHSAPIIRAIKKLKKHKEGGPEAGPGGSIDGCHGGGPKVVQMEVLMHGGHGGCHGGGSEGGPDGGPGRGPEGGHSAGHGGGPGGNPDSIPQTIIKTCSSHLAGPFANTPVSNTL